MARMAGIASKKSPHPGAGEARSESSKLPPIKIGLAKRPMALILPALFSILRPHSVMSQHRSLRASSSVGSKRSVLKRGERIKLLKSRGQWKDGQLPVNLPKTKPE